MLSNSQIRELSFRYLGKKVFGKTWLLMAVVCAIIASISAFLLNGFSAGGSAAEGGEMVVSAGSLIGYKTIIYIVIYGWLQTALAAVSISMARSGGNPHFPYLFQGLKKQFFIRTILLGLRQQLFIALNTLLLVIPGIVKFYAYSLAYFVALDNPDMKAKDCLSKSKALMDGHKKQLFMLDLSFCPWYILGGLGYSILSSAGSQFLGGLCLAAVIFFVLPYHTMARAHFYKSRAFLKD